MTTIVGPITRGPLTVAKLIEYLQRVDHPDFLVEVWTGEDYQPIALSHVDLRNKTITFS